MARIAQKLKDRIRRRVSDFSKGTIAGSKLLLPFFSFIKKNHIPAFLFGGTLRDFALSKNFVTPRDLDLVVGVSIETIEDFFLTERANFSDSKNWGVKVRRNRFGGLKVDYSGHSLDIWRLEDTWAFKNNFITPPAFENLPRTTFLSIDAIAMELFSTTRGRKLFEKGFFRSVENETIDINLEENPSPSLCIIRAIVLAHKTGFKLSPKLGSYIKWNRRTVSLEELSSIQSSHYGDIKQSEESLIESFRIIVQHHSLEDRSNFDIACKQFELKLNEDASPNFDFNFSAPRKTNKRRHNLEQMIRSISD